MVVSPLHPRLVPGLWATTGLMVLMAIPLAWPLLRQAPLDVWAYHLACLLAEQGQNPYDLGAMGDKADEMGLATLPYLYPPTFLTLERPLLCGSTKVAVWGTWFLGFLSIAALATAVRRLVQTSHCQPRLAHALVALLFAASLNALAEGLAMGNTNIHLVGLLSLVAISALQYPRAAGAAIGAATAAKLTPVLLTLPLPLLGRRGAYSLGAGILAGLTVLGASLLWTGSQPMVLYATEVLPALDSALAERGGFAWGGSDNGALVAVLAEILPEGPAHGLARAVQLLLVGATCAVLWARRPELLDTENSHVGWLLSLPLLLVVACSPFGWLHAVPIMLLPVLATLLALAERTSGQRQNIFWGGLLLLSYLLAVLPGRQALGVMRAAPQVSACVICLYLAWRLRPQDVETGETDPVEPRLVPTGDLFEHGASLEDHHGRS